MPKKENPKRKKLKGGVLGERMLTPDMYISSILQPNIGHCTF